MFALYVAIIVFYSFIVAGFYMLPVSTLVEPSNSLLVRETSELFIDSLKKEILENPIADVQPMLCIVQLPPDNRILIRSTRRHINTKQLEATIRESLFKATHNPETCCQALSGYKL